MNQIAIDFNPATHARRGDPATSHDAAARVREFAGGQCADIMLILRQYGKQTPEQIGQRLHLDSYAVRKRLPELEKAGLARPTGETAPTASGRSQRIWMAMTA